ncbi:MAG: hypothetical protein Q9218_007010, partial [Villophora microphyllina]
DPFQFGSRYLLPTDNPFEFNAWDHVEPSPSDITHFESQVLAQRASPVSEFDRQRFNTEPEKWWNRFYANNTSNFFKDRKWLRQEFPVLKEVTEKGAGRKVLLEVGAGAGNTCFPVLRGNENEDLMVYACDFSQKAIGLIREAEAYDEEHLRAEVWDVSSQEMPPGLEEESVDVVIMVFIFSALHPTQWEQATCNIWRLLKPGGEVCFRDYGRGDLAQVRMKKGRWMEENFYIRGDGTRVYFFGQDELRNIWSGTMLRKVDTDGRERNDGNEEDAAAEFGNQTSGSAIQDHLSNTSDDNHESTTEMRTGVGFEIASLGVDRRLLINRHKQLKMYRFPVPKPNPIRWGLVAFVAERLVEVWERGCVRDPEMTKKTDQPAAYHQLAADAATSISAGGRRYHPTVDEKRVDRYDDGGKQSIEGEEERNRDSFMDGIWILKRVVAQRKVLVVRFDGVESEKDEEKDTWLQKPQGDLTLPPAKKYAIGTYVAVLNLYPLFIGSRVCLSNPTVTCMDARIHAPEAFGVSLGDAHIIRNAGGSARDALRSLVISEQLLGTTEILLIKHTGCGMLTFSNAGAHAVVEKALGKEAEKELGGLDFLPFGDLEGAVREEVQWLRESKAIPEDVTVSGWVYEVETGRADALSIAAPALVASGAYLNARFQLLEDLTAISGLSLAKFNGALAEYRDRCNAFYTLERHAHAKRTANHPFLIYREVSSRNSHTEQDFKTWTFKEVYDTVLKYGTWLKTTHRIAPKEIVALIFMNRPEFLFVWLGLWSIGAYPALINYNLTGGPLIHCLTTSTARLVFVDEEVQDRFTADVTSAISSPTFRDNKGPMKKVVFSSSTALFIDSTIIGVREPDASRSGDPIHHMSALSYTSGTTGFPKAAIISWGKFAIGGEYVGRWLKLKRNDRFYTCMPLYHATAGILGFGPCLTHGVTFVLGHRFSHRTFWPEVRDSGATLIQYVGETLRYLLTAPPQKDPVTGQDLDRKNKVRLAFGNGLRSDVWKRFQDRFGIEAIAEFYSATEGTGACWNLSRNDYAVGAVGRNGSLSSKLLESQSAVVKVDWETETPFQDPKNHNLCVRVPRGEPGELLYKIDPADIPRTFQGYFNNTKATESKLLRSVLVKDDAYFRTGDVMKWDKEGRWWFADRIGDTFRWKSENVSTAEVSEALGIHPAVGEANVYGVQLPHHEGRAGCATIMFNDAREADQTILDDIATHVRKSLPRYAVPLFLRITKDMQTTGNNKQQKHILRAEGVDPTKVRDSGDQLFWLKEGTYKAFDDNDWETLEAGQAKL